MTQRDFRVGRVALLKLLNAGFAPHGCGRDLSQKNLAPLRDKPTPDYKGFCSPLGPSQPVCQSETSYKIGLGMRPV